MSETSPTESGSAAAATPADASASTIGSTTGSTTATVTVQRSPRYLRFFFVGVSLGVIVALILTVSFPPDPQFTQTQVFGFLVIFTGAGGAVLGLVFALIVDRFFSRHVIETTAELTSVNEAPAVDALPGAGALPAGSDTTNAPGAPATEAPATETPAIER